MTRAELEQCLTIDFLPLLGDSSQEMSVRPIVSTDRIRLFTTKALTVFDSHSAPAALWGYSSAFNPLAFVETIMPPNFHYLLHCDHWVIDPVRTGLSKRPFIFDLDKEDDQLAILSAYGHPSRWLSCSKDLSRYIWKPDQTIACPIDYVFHDHKTIKQGTVQVRTDHTPLCTLPSTKNGLIFAQTLVRRAFLAGCKEATLYENDGSNWNLLERIVIPEPARYFADRAQASEPRARIYRLPGRSYALHLLGAAIGIPQANTLLRNLTQDMGVNETRLQPLQNLLELHVSSSPYGDADFAFHIREKLSDPSVMRPLYMDAAQALKPGDRKPHGRQYAPRRRGRSQTRSK